ncbi:hypothetical protein [Rhodococcus sp. ACPA1]|uniref:hypothetical protein n=1 Tax=Rhodococcus sp. ACPA1 TaxID=2028572 RepID=UPI00117A9060|nr:hypothetical protein [Rhodococcus sp. ACPA1]
MTLIVARKHGDKISAVADTKITVHPTREAGSRRSLREYDAPVLKMAIVRSDLLVGVAGDAPPEALTAAAKHWHKGPAEDVLEALKNYTTSNDNGFVVAALSPARLWKVANGVVYERTARGETWEGTHSRTRPSWNSTPSGRTLAPSTSAS